MGNARLLVVEDDVDIANMLKIYFTSLHYDVDIANRGRDALEKTKQVLPHLIVLDIMLPDIDGYEVCRMLKFDENYKNIPIIILSALDQQEDREKAVKSGADAYFIKPFDLDLLVTKVKSFIG